MSDSEHPPALREVPTVAGTFLAYGALFFDRLAPLYLVALIASDLSVSREGQGILALTIGVGWAGSMALARWASGRWGNRRRILVAAAGVSLLGAASALVTGWTAFVVLRGLGGLLAGTARLRSRHCRSRQPRRTAGGSTLVWCSPRLVCSVVSSRP